LLIGPQPSELNTFGETIPKLSICHLDKSFPAQQTKKHNVSIRGKIKMKEGKQELKSKWLSCLADMFETAKNSGKKRVTVTYPVLRDRVNSKYPDINVTGRAPSYCNALRSVLQDDDIKEGTEGSSTYRVTFMLPRNKPLSLDRQDKRTGQNNFSKCKKTKHDLSLFKDEMTRIGFLQKTENEYRPGDKGRILYKGVVQYSGDKYSREFIKKVYQILIAWNMNAKAAKLNDLHPFIKTMQDNVALFKTLENIKIDKLSDTVVMTTLESLFCKLELVKTKSKLVTFAKTMHFFFPALIVPIDRKYTLGFFKINHYNIDTLEKQWDVFERLERLFSDFSKTIDLNTYIDENGDWNLNVPKIIDNLIIGHHLSEGKPHE
jgi:hypothetical protein